MKENEIKEYVENLIKETEKEKKEFLRVDKEMQEQIKKEIGFVESEELFAKTESLFKFSVGLFEGRLRTLQEIKEKLK